mgnify:CR=1 FL=1
MCNVWCVCILQNCLTVLPNTAHHTSHATPRSQLVWGAAPAAKCDGCSHYHSRGRGPANKQLPHEQCVEQLLSREVGGVGSMVFNVIMLNMLLSCLSLV